ncbi:hypothetical protein Tco_1560306 [Tanacetum coccineum]
MAALQYKDDHNRIAYLGRERGSEDFTDILGYLDHSPLRYALTHDPPVVFDSLVKQFWATATVRPNAAGSHDLVATIDGHNFIERMLAIKERKKRALADLRYRALKGKPLKQSEVTQMMRNLVKNQWCAAHNGTITMKAVKAMSKQQLTEEYENICRRLEKDRLLSAQYNLFRPKPAITEPPSKRQRVDNSSPVTSLITSIQ